MKDMLEGRRVHAVVMQRGWIKNIPPVCAAGGMSVRAGSPVPATLFVVSDGGLRLLRQLRRHLLHAVGGAGVLGHLTHDLLVRLTTGHEIAVRAHIPATHSPRHSLTSAGIIWGRALPKNRLTRLKV